jgi:hypothetical protein
MLMNGVIPMPPAMKTAGRDASPCSVKDPDGPSMPAAAPAGSAASARLNALSRRRVATVRRSSNGALAIEKVWRFESVAPAAPSSDTSIACPALNVNPAGRAK